MKWQPDNGCGCSILFDGVTEDGELANATFERACPIHRDCTPVDVHNDNRRASLVRASLDARGFDATPERVQFNLELDRTITVLDRPGSKAAEVDQHLEENYWLLGARVSRGQ